MVLILFLIIMVAVVVIVDSLDGISERSAKIRLVIATIVLLSCGYFLQYYYLQ